MSSTAELVAQYQSMLPPHKSLEDLRLLAEAAGGDPDAVHRTVVAWWSGTTGTTPAKLRPTRSAAPPPPPPPPPQRSSRPPPPPPAHAAEESRMVEKFMSAYGPMLPPEKDEQDLHALILECEGREEDVQAGIVKWWTRGAGGATPARLRPQLGLAPEAGPAVGEKKRKAKKASGKGSKKKSSKAKSAPKKTAASSSSSSGKKDKKVDPLKRKMDEFVTRYSQYTPEHKNASDVKALVMACDFNELAIERVIAQWWKGPNARVVMRYRPPSKPKPIHPDDAQEIELERVKQKSAALKFDKELTDFASLMVKGIELKLCEGEEKRQVVFYMSVDAVTLYVASEKHAADAAAYPIDSMTSVAADSSDKALIIGTGSKKIPKLKFEVASHKVRDYLVKMIVKLARLEKGMDVEHGKGRGAKAAKKAKNEARKAAAAKGKDGKLQRKNSVVDGRDSQVKVKKSAPNRKASFSLGSMFGFGSAKDKDTRSALEVYFGDEEGGATPTKKKESKRPGLQRNQSFFTATMGQKGGTLSRGGMALVEHNSRVKLLSQHCFSLPVNRLQSLVTAPIPTHSKFESYNEFKEKIARRDQLINALQESLGKLNEESLRFQNAVEDVEGSQSSELMELKQHLAMALTSFQELQRTADDREDEMKEALTSAVERGSKYEAERMVLGDKMANQSTESVEAVAEVSVLRQAMAKIEYDSKAGEGEVESTRELLANVKENLAVERNLRERAETRVGEEVREKTAAAGQYTALAHHRDEAVLRHKEKAIMENLGIKGDLGELTGKYRELTGELESNRAAIESSTTSIQTLQADLEGAGAQLTQLRELAEKAGEISSLEAKVATLRDEMHTLTATSTERIEELESKQAEQAVEIQAGEKERRKMHNLIQELRGNVRVYVRVRPYLGKHDFLQAMDVPFGKNHGILPPYCTDCKPDGYSCAIRKFEGDPGTCLAPKLEAIVEEHNFAFDKIFGPQHPQATIFDEVAEFVQSALDGFNVCLFSYGQTGSGKTHTMQGDGFEDQAGIIPRAVARVAEYRDEQLAQGWSYEMAVSFVEIYNEVCFDLLKEPDAKGKKIPMSIKQDAKGKTYVENVQITPCDPGNRAELEAILDFAWKHRAVGGTDMNAQSSRSHSVFTLHLTAKNSKNGAKLAGELHLCDLAGSERVDRSGAQGARLKEAININKSLSCLGDVFVGVAKKSSHVPFRNSKLTYLLQPALSGDGKTMMFVNLSPTIASYFESLSSLRFAKLVNQCELGKAVRSIAEAPEDWKEGDQTPPRGNTPPNKAKGAGGAKKSPPRQRR